jgi:hypothetical protein
VVADSVLFHVRVSLLFTREFLHHRERLKNRAGILSSAPDVVNFAAARRIAESGN